MLAKISINNQLRYNKTHRRLSSASFIDDKENRYGLYKMASIWSANCFFEKCNLHQIAILKSRSSALTDISFVITQNGISKAIISFYSSSIIILIFASAPEYNSINFSSMAFTCLLFFKYRTNLYVFQVFNGFCVESCPHITYNHTCLDACPVGMYTDHTGCLQCDEECTSCTGPGPTACNRLANISPKLLYSAKPSHYRNLNPYSTHSLCTIK